jgi:hypothetical protein
MSWDVEVSQETSTDFSHTGTEERKVDIPAAPHGSPASNKTVRPSASLGMGQAGWDVVPKRANTLRNVEIWAPGGYAPKEDEGRERGLKRWVKGVFKPREG